LALLLQELVDFGLQGFGLGSCCLVAGEFEALFFQGAEALAQGLFALEQGGGDALADVGAGFAE